MGRGPDLSRAVQRYVVIWYLSHHESREGDYYFANGLFNQITIIRTTRPPGFCGIMTMLCIS
jgi:hypothetical protein